MKTQKIKRYRLGVSRTFPITHPRKGSATNFVENIIAGQIDKNDNYKINTDAEYDARITYYCTNPKLHTIRSNYELWTKRMKEVQAGRAVIELFYWSGKPYRKDENGIGQIVFATLDKDSGCGVQELSPISTLGKIIEWKDVIIYSDENTYSEIPVTTLAKNDGLEFEDFKDWFKGYDLSQSMAIIHFTPYRY